MSMNAQVMKVMKNGVEVAKYKGANYTVLFEEAPAVENPFSWTVGSAIALMDGTNNSKYNYVSGDGNTLSSFALADGQTAVSGENIYAFYPYAESSSRAVTQAEAEAAAGEFSYYLDVWKNYIERNKEDRATSQMQAYGISAENQAIILAYLKNEPIGTPGVALDGSSIKNVVIPAEQTAIADAADPQAAVKVAKADGENLVFADVCAYIKVTPQFDCCAIALTCKGDEQIAGKVDINYNNGEPTTTVTADGTNTLYLVGTITAGNSYYIAVRPETLAAGYTIEFLTADKGTYYAQSTDDELELERGSVNDLGEFTTSGAWTVSSPTSGDDGNGHSWKLITPTIKLATSFAYDVNSDDGARFGDVSTTYSWGSDWVLPSPDDFQYLWANKLFVSNNGIIKFRGEGILKNVVDFDVFVSSWNSFWTSTPGAASNTQKKFYLHDGSFYDYDINGTGNIIYKYNN